MKAAPSHPPYLKMIQEAIASIKDRKGATRPAIKTFLLGVGEQQVQRASFVNVIRFCAYSFKKKVITFTNCDD